MNKAPKLRNSIEWEGCEPEPATREEAQATLQACAFLRKREPMTVTINGKTTTSRDIPRPWGLTDRAKEIAGEILMVRMKCGLEPILPRHTNMDILPPKDTYVEGHTTMEISDGWSITCEIDPQRRGNPARWNVYGPEGEPIIENTTDTQAAAALASSIAAYHCTQNFVPTNQP